MRKNMQKRTSHPTSASPAAVSTESAATDSNERAAFQQHTTCCRIQKINKSQLDQLAQRNFSKFYEANGGIFDDFRSFRMSTAREPQGQACARTDLKNSTTGSIRIAFDVQRYRVCWTTFDAEKKNTGPVADQLFPSVRPSESPVQIGSTLKL